MPRRALRALAAISAASLLACAAHAKAPPSPPPGGDATARGEVTVRIEPVPPIVEITTATVAMLDVATLLAAPKVALGRSMPPQAELLHVLDYYLQVGQQYSDMIDNTDAPIGPRMETCALRLRFLLSAWIPSRDVPEPIRLEARAMLSAMGVSEPPFGWDAFPGFAPRGP